MKAEVVPDVALDDIAGALLVMAGPASDDPHDLLRREIVAEQVAEYLGLHMASARPARYASHLPPGLAPALLDCLRTDLAVRLQLTPLSGSLAQILSVTGQLLRSDCLPALLLRLDERLDRPAGSARLREPQDTMRSFVRALQQVYADEWRGRDLAQAAEGADELVLTTARLLAGIALMDTAERTAGFLETAARRYAWRWFRRPCPEAAGPLHRRRTDELLASFTTRAAPDESTTPGRQP